MIQGLVSLVKEFDFILVQQEALESNKQEHGDPICV